VAPTASNAEPSRNREGWWRSNRPFKEAKAIEDIGTGDADAVSGQPVHGLIQKRRIV
jgi:hypothetical protein